MIIALGIIEDNNSLIGIRIYDTDKKSIKDIRIEDANKIKIKNRSKIYRIGVIDNKKEPKPLILLGYKDRKALVIDINGRTKVIEDISKYEVVDIKSNIEEYNEYITKLRMLGEDVFNYEIKEETDEVLITEYIENNESERIIEIPSFVTGIKKDRNGDNLWIFCGVNQSLKVIHRHNQIKDMNSLFYGFRGEKLDIRNFDTSKVTDMHNMFNWCENLKELDIRKFDISNVKDMHYIFSDCKNLEVLDVSNFDTSKVTNMSNMFNWCENLKEIDLSNFDTSNVTDISYMFSNCENLKELELSNFDTSNVKDMQYMFSECNNLKELDLRNFDTSKVTNMCWMFNGCNNLERLDLSNFDTSNVETMYCMFYGCENLKELDLSNFDTSKVENMRDIFFETYLTEENTGLK